MKQNIIHKQQDKKKQTKLVFSMNCEIIVSQVYVNEMPCV